MPQVSVWNGVAAVKNAKAATLPPVSCITNGEQKHVTFLHGSKGAGVAG